MRENTKISKKHKRKKITLVCVKTREPKRKKERKKEGKRERDNANNTTIDRTVP